MMCYMGSPEQAAIMIGAVQPILHKIFCYKQSYPVYAGGMYFCKAVGIKKGKYNANIDAPEKNINGGVGQHKVNILYGVFQGIGGLALQVAEQDFKPNHYHIQWRADEY